MAMDAFSASLMADKREIIFAPTVYKFQAFAQMASGGKQRDEDDPLHDPAGPWDYGDQYYPDHVLRYYHISSESETS